MREDIQRVILMDVLKKWGMNLDHVIGDRVTSMKEDEDALDLGQYLSGERSVKSVKFASSKFAILTKDG